MQKSYFQTETIALIIGLSIFLTAGCGEVNISEANPKNLDEQESALFALTGGISIIVDSTKPSGNNFSGQLPAGFASTNAQGNTVIAWNRSTSGQWCAWSHGCVPSAASGPIACTNGNPTCSVSNGVLNCKINDNPHTDNSNISGQPCVVRFFPPSTPTCSISISSGLVGGRIPRAGGSLQFTVTTTAGASVTQNPNGSVAANTSSSPIQRTFRASVRNSSTGQTGSCNITVEQEGLTPPTCSLSVTSGAVNGVIPQGGGTLNFRVTPSSGASITRDPSGSLVTANNGTSPIQRTFQAQVRNSSTGLSGSCSINVPQAGTVVPPSCSISISSGLIGGMIPESGGRLGFSVTPSSGASVMQLPTNNLINPNTNSLPIDHNFQATVRNSSTGKTGTCTVAARQAGVMQKTTTFDITMRAFIEGKKLNCPAIVQKLLGINVLNPIHRHLADFLCSQTKISFPETPEEGILGKARLFETFKLDVVCRSTDQGKTFFVERTTAGQPNCKMGPEPIGPPEWGIVPFTGVLGNCIANGGKPAFSSVNEFSGFITGSPPWKLDTGLQVMRNRLCTEIKIGIQGRVGCTNNGVATLTATLRGTNFPSLQYAIKRTKPAPFMTDGDIKYVEQLDMPQLWECPGGKMAEGQKGMFIERFSGD